MIYLQMIFSEGEGSAPPLYGNTQREHTSCGQFFCELRTKGRLMHDLLSVTRNDAIL
jgi:hypothetical protein